MGRSPADSWVTARAKPPATAPANPARSFGPLLQALTHGSQ